MEHQLKILEFRLFQKDRYNRKKKKNLWRMDPNMYRRTICFFTSNFINVDNKLLTVNTHYTSSVSFVMSSSNGDLVIYSKTIPSVN